MDGLSSFSENMFSFVNMLGRRGDMLEMPSGSVAAYSGEPYAGENWALFTPRSDTEELDTVVEFFKDYVGPDTPYLVPKMPGMTERFVSALEKHGLVIRKRYKAMRLTKFKKHERDEAFIEIPDDLCPIWASAVWSGFDSGGRVTESYVDFARTMLADRSNRLYALSIDNTPVCTALLHKSPRTCGLYYFATLPDYRRRGLARRLMNSLMDEDITSGHGLVLLSTEEGYPFYHDYGFETITDIQIRCLTEDI